MEKDLETEEGVLTARQQHAYDMARELASVLTLEFLEQLRHDRTETGEKGAIELAGVHLRAIHEQLDALMVAALEANVTTQEVELLRAVLKRHEYPQETWIVTSPSH